ncbi:hypothetical protein [Synergistes jonesii]|uniref:hypothetical protein n=1 Tax=Synergistes jonesii TaxID=2754 RepID=UPI003325872D
MLRLSNGREERLRFGELVMRRQRAQAWADDNISQCLADCDERGFIDVSQPDGFLFKIVCPLLARQCPRGISFTAMAAQKAFEMLPCEVPKRFRGEVGKARETFAVFGARKWDGKGCLYIYGDTGTGKSFAAAWRIYQDILRRFDKYWDVPWRWNQYRPAGVRWFSAYKVCLERSNLYEAEGAAFLVLDDLGCEVRSPATKAALNELISVRYNEQRPTVITSNCDLVDLEKYYMQRMYERIIHSNNVVNAGRENLRIGTD